MVHNFSCWYLINHCLGYYHIQLSKLKKFDGEKKKQLPRSMLFEYVSCPHYLFEIISWLGFALVTQTFASTLFAVAVIAILALWASERHDNYRKGFPNYPSSRKRLIPFVF